MYSLLKSEVLETKIDDDARVDSDALSELDVL